MHFREIDLQAVMDDLLNLNAILCAAASSDNLQNVVIRMRTVAGHRDEVGEIVAEELRSWLPMLDERGVLGYVFTSPIRH